MKDGEYHVYEPSKENDSATTKPLESSHLSAQNAKVENDNASMRSPREIEGVITEVEGDSSTTQQWPLLPPKPISSHQRLRPPLYSPSQGQIPLHQELQPPHFSLSRKHGFHQRAKQLLSLPSRSHLLRSTTKIRAQPEPICAGAHACR